MKFCVTHSVETVIVKIENQRSFTNVQCFGFTIGVAGISIGEVNLPGKRRTFERFYNAYKYYPLPVATDKVDIEENDA